MESGLPYTFVRAIYFMQNTLAVAPTVASAGTIYMPMKDGKVGIIDARDVAEAVATVLTSDGHEGKSYLLTGPESISIHDVADTLSRVLGNEVKYVNVPPEGAKEAMLGMGLPAWVADGIIETAGALSEGLGDYTTDDFEKLTGHRANSYETFARDFSTRSWLMVIRCRVWRLGLVQIMASDTYAYPSADKWVSTLLG